MLYTKIVHIYDGSKYYVRGKPASIHRLLQTLPCMANKEGNMRWI